MAPPTPLTVLNVNYEEVEMQQSLDRGAFGEVYVGRWRGNEVAVKVRMCPIERVHLLWYSSWGDVAGPQRAIHCTALHFMTTCVSQYISFPEHFVV